MNIGDIYMTFRGESQQLAVDAKKSGEQAADVGAKSFGQRFKAAFSKANIGQSIAAGFGIGAGLGVFGLVTSALGSVVAIAGEAQQAASDLGEQQSKLDQVFDASAGTIREWAEDAATSMGLSERAALEATGTLGNFLQAMGTTEADSADMSMSLVQLSSDLASFNNTAGGAEEVLLAIQSGLAGETEPLRRFGIDISDAAVQARLLADGVQKVGGAFTQSQKIQARYAIIMAKTTKAQGDYARTAFSSANQERTLDALRENALSTIGRYIDNLVKVGQALAIHFVGGLEAVGDALEDVNRLLFPHEALLADIEEAFIAEAAAMGISTKAAKAFLIADRELQSEEGRLAAARERMIEIEEMGAEVQAGRLKLTEEETQALAVEALGLSLVTGAYAENTAATEANTEAAEESDAVRVGVTDHMSRLVKVSKEELAGLELIGAAMEENTEDAQKMAAALADATKREKALGEQADQARRELRDLAGEVDSTKDGIKSFWKTVREEQRRIRWFVRHPDVLRRELDRIEEALDKSERQKQKILADGFQEGDALALRAMDDRIALLRGRRDSYLALGQLYGNKAEQGMEQAFDPRLMASIVPQLVTGGREWLKGLFGGSGGRPPEQHHYTGRVEPGLPMLIGERGHEQAWLPDVGGFMWDAPDTREMQAVPAGGDTHWHIEPHITGTPLYAPTPLEIAQQLRRTARFGTLRRRRPAWGTA